MPNDYSVAGVSEDMKYILTTVCNLGAGALLYTMPHAVFWRKIKLNVGTKTITLTWFE